MAVIELEQSPAMLPLSTAAPARGVGVMGLEGQSGEQEAVVSLLGGGTGQGERLGCCPPQGHQEGAQSEGKTRGDKGGTGFCQAQRWRAP